MKSLRVVCLDYRSSWYRLGIVLVPMSLIVASSDKIDSEEGFYIFIVLLILAILTSMDDVEKYDVNMHKFFLNYPEVEFKTC